MLTTGTTRYGRIMDFKLGYGYNKEFDSHRVAKTLYQWLPTFLFWHAPSKHL